MIKNEPIKVKRIDNFDDDVIMLKQFTTQKLSEELISKKIEAMNCYSCRFTQSLNHGLICR